MKEWWKWQEDEEDVSIYWMTVRQREDTGNWRRKHLVEMFREIVLEEAMDLS